jgi:tRNA 2-thiouridine synthesizing protein A
MPQSQTKSTHEIDVRAYVCPVPIIKVSNSMKQLNTGDVLKVSAKGDGTLKDMSALCARTGNQMIEHINNNEELTFFIRKS